MAEQTDNAKVAHLLPRGSTCRRVPGVERFVVEELEESGMVLTGYRFAVAPGQEAGDLVALVARVGKTTQKREKRNADGDSTEAK